MVSLIFIDLQVIFHYIWKANIIDKLFFKLLSLNFLDALQQFQMQFSPKENKYVCSFDQPSNRKENKKLPNVLEKNHTKRLKKQINQTRTTQHNSVLQIRYTEWCNLNSILYFFKLMSSKQFVPIKTLINKFHVPDSSRMFCLYILIFCCTGKHRTRTDHNHCRFSKSRK